MPWISSSDQAMEIYRNLIKQQYLQSRCDATQLFRTILTVAEEIGIDRSLAYLEQCVTEKRLSWLQEHLRSMDTTGLPVQDGYRLFYEVYLGVSVPEDGEIVAQTGQKIVMRWWNPCPTLAACLVLGLDTRKVCKKAYHKPVQDFLARINPRLRFDRNYTAIRPYRLYCEEIIFLEDVETTRMG